MVFSMVDTRAGQRVEMTAEYLVEGSAGHWVEMMAAQTALR